MKTKLLLLFAIVAMALSVNAQVTVNYPHIQGQLILNVNGKYFNVTESVHGNPIVMSREINHKLAFDVPYHTEVGNYRIQAMLFWMYYYQPEMQGACCASMCPSDCAHTIYADVQLTNGATLQYCGDIIDLYNGNGYDMDGNYIRPSDIKEVRVNNFFSNN